MISVLSWTVLWFKIWEYVFIIVTVADAMYMGQHGAIVGTQNHRREPVPAIEAKRQQLSTNYIDDFDLIVARVKRDALDFQELHKFKWNQKRLTWRIMNYPSRHSPITPYQVYLDIEKAFNLWGSMAPIEFVVTNNKEADIRISFLTKRHGDKSPFDGRLGIRGHAFYPGSDPYGRLDGDIHLDDDEIFTHHRSVENGTNLMYVVAHEIGHSLGLYHSTNGDSIMRPDYKDFIADDKLPLPDARAIQKLYGKKPGIPHLPPESTTPASPPPFDCKSDYAAAVIRGCLILFQDSRYWRFSDESLTSDLFSSQFGYPSQPYFKNLPSNIGAAFTLYNGTTVFIRGRNMWLYNFRTRIDAKYPLRIRRYFGIPKNIDAAFHSPRRRITYFFKDKRMWKFYHRAGGKAVRARARKEFNDLPGDLSAAYEDQQGNRFFLKDDRYWKYAYGDKQIAAGYPKLFPSAIC